jgi:hypothetical protein
MSCDYAALNCFWEDELRYHHYPHIMCCSSAAFLLQ